ncbi:MAG: hypothetical protein KAT11_01850, partial [Phycisphaerae bacterium]|nr:hypothetical protein [Phycisphaerae bacterium]
VPKSMPIILAMAVLLVSGTFRPWFLQTPDYSLGLAAWTSSKAQSYHVAVGAKAVPSTQVS